jgi:phosphatidylglycerophosphatase A
VSAVGKIPAGALKNPLHLLALGFGSGLAPKLPGTAGTLVGVLIYLPLQQLSLPAYAAVVTLMLLAGIWICGRTAADLGVPDHPGIVWDEIAGYLLAMLAAPRGWMWIMLGFGLFRVFDILKPWPVGWLDKNVQGGLGIMADDVMAAVYSLVSIQIIAYLLES